MYVVKGHVVAGKIQTASPRVQQILFRILLLPFLRVVSVVTFEEHVIIPCAFYILSGEGKQ